MPWIIQSRLPDFLDNPDACPECHGSPPDSGNGMGQCSTCRAILVSRDPISGELLTLKFIPVDEKTQKRLARRHRREIEIKWGDKLQADGTLARFYRLIDKVNDRYIETVDRVDGHRTDQDEPLSRHRGHGSDRPDAV